LKLNNYASRNDLLIDWILESTTEKCSALDVGANDGSFCPEVIRISQRVKHLSGVDPDVEKLQRNPLLSQRYPSTLEDAEISPESFDLLYSFYVFEHVDDEERFISAASRVLKPGGSLFFITPNGSHYFAFLSSLFARLKVQRSVLGLLRPAELVDAYHYPAVYKLNCPKDIEKVGRKYGFDRFEYRYCECFDDVSCYFPGVTKVFPKLWETTAKISGWESMLVNFMGRMIKSKQS
jgi:SAM-dependent methyltransferase